MGLVLAGLRSVSQQPMFGALAPTKSSAENVKTVDGAINSAPAGTLTEDAATPGTADPNCGDDATPFDEKGVRLVPGDAMYALKRFYCLLSAGVSPDTPIGAVNALSGFACLAEKQADFTYSKAAATVAVQYEDLAAADDWKSCFSSALIAAVAKDKGKAGWKGHFGGTRFDTGAWTNRLELLETETDSGFTEFVNDSSVWFATKPGKVAFKHHDVSGSLDFEKGTLRFEDLGTSNGRHFRLLVRGELNNDGTFKNVSEVSVMGNENADSTHIYTGSTSDSGTVFNQFRYHYVLSGWNHLGTACLGAGDCAANAGIEISSGKAIDFTSSDTENGIEQIAAWTERHLPLCFESVEATLLPAEDCSF
jgi:hypothetical protein